MPTEDRPLHPAYFHVRFRVEESVASWLSTFAIVSGYATTGEQWTSAQNEASDRALATELQARSGWVRRITGYSPETGHAEPGWAVELTEEEAREVGRQFRQDAIYLVQDRQLVVTRCEPGSALVFVAPFDERVDLASA